MSASDFLRRHGWQMRANHWEHPKFPDVLHSEGGAMKLTLPEARYVCGCGKVFHNPFKCCGGDAFKLPEGMHLVSDADVRVLEAIGRIPQEWVERCAQEWKGPAAMAGAAENVALARAELARREGK